MVLALAEGVAGEPEASKSPMEGAAMGPPQTSGHHLLERDMCVSSAHVKVHNYLFVFCSFCYRMPESGSLLRLFVSALCVVCCVVCCWLVALCVAWYLLIVDC